MPMRRKLLKEGGFKNIENIENLACNNISIIFHALNYFYQLKAISL